MIRKRLAVRFALQMAAAGAMLVLLAAVIAIWMLGKFEDIEVSRNFAPLGISRLISEAGMDSQGLIVDPKLLRRLQEDGGWLQSLDGKGNVLQSFNAPNDLPTRYLPGQLIDYWIGNEPFPYKLGLWMQEKDGHLYTLLYGSRSRTKDLLGRVIDDGHILNHTILFTDSSLDLLNKIGGWIQVLDREGAEVASWRKPGDALTSYTLQELAMRAHNQAHYGIAMDSQFDSRTGLTWIIQYPMNQTENQASRAPFIQSEVQVIIIGIAAFLFTSFIVFILLSLWYANRFGTPILHILGWIQRMGEGDYTEGNEGKGRNRKGIWKRKYRIFGEVMESVHSLAVRLHAGKDAAEQTQRNREEWIAGVTHDMKTPLASIQGYAHMLEAEKYSWSVEDVRRFASTILEKTAYMDKLLNDLALTYRLRSGEIPVHFEPKDIGILLTESALRAAAHPAFESREVHCSTPSTPIIVDVYPPWFDRIVENIVANGLMHNPPGTRIDIALIKLSEKGWRVDFGDNGHGMDQLTMERLFDRYYRGTNTDSAIEGSGLGMAVTKELVHAMGGRIEVNSRNGQGTVISIIWDA
ncbi:sensor histidine kinase [Paenibacillus harenae]|uniref:histidine kinase n=1 Tax=Paenibacillus harenae TaxID=306543 RepID=A0ABT9U110_PAEHA|nr:HAMP domain-containing sensor histidine kinase [Paenibacillus harenae]MDQ0113293.1 signal transduction histidine kinase [Paenibacillus harenae]